MANTINWFEIPVVEFERARDFYNNILATQIQEVPMGSEYIMGMFPTQDGVGGAIVKGENCIPSATGTLIYLNGGDDLQTILARVENAGGQVAVPKTQISPEHGYFAVFMDTEGNKIGLHSMN